MEESHHESAQLRVIVRNLYEKAPDTARFLAATILEYSAQDSIEGPQPQVDNSSTQVDKSTTQVDNSTAQVDNSTTQPLKRKSASGKDLSYRPPKDGKAKAEKIRSKARR